MPDSTTVAGPVRADSAISCTGRVLGAGEVLGEAADALGQHEADDDGAEALPAGVGVVVADVDRGPRSSVPTTVRMPAVRKPRLIGLRALVSPSLAFTAKTPTIEASTPMARAASGKTRPRAGLAPIELKAATPRMIEATRVTS